jgi:hypothetical protein
MTTGFDAYKLPLGLSEGVTIKLPGTPAEFLVRLPSHMDEDFQLEMMSALNATRDEDGNMSVDPIMMQAKRKDLFFSTCILEATGLPDGMLPATFFASYPLAKKAVFEKVMELCEVAEREVSAAMEKLNDLSNTKSSGPARKSSTKTSSKQASSPPPAVQS